MTKTLEVAAMIELEQLHEKREERKLARHPYLYLKPEYAKELVDSENWAIWEDLVYNPAIFQLPKVLEELLEKPTLDPAHEGDEPAWAFLPLPLQCTFALNPALVNHRDYIASLLSHPSDQVRGSLAGNPALAQLPDVAMELAADAAWLVRLDLAGSPSLAQLPEVATKLANDTDDQVRYDLAKNPALAQLPDVVQALSRDPKQKVRDALARNAAISIPEENPPQNYNIVANGVIIAEVRHFDLT